MGKVKFRTYDLGGHKEARRLWKDYFGSVDGVVYLVDSSDATRIAESKKELDGLLSDPDLATTPFIILGNKIDLEGAMSEPQLRDALGLHQVSFHLCPFVLLGPHFPFIRPLEKEPCRCLTT